jgi:hypothetical protein
VKDELSQSTQSKKLKCDWAFSSAPLSPIAGPAPVCFPHTDSGKESTLKGVSESAAPEGQPTFGGEEFSLKTSDVG